MRLCLVTPGFSASDDDWCIPALHHLVRRLAQGHEVSVIALRYPHDASRYGFHGARVRALGGGDRGGLSRAALIVRALAEIRRIHRQTPLDAIHGFWADEAGFVAATAGRVLGIRSVVSVMGGELVGLPAIDYGLQLHRTGRWLVNRSLSRADAVTVGSTGLATLAGDRLGGRTPILTPLGVDTSLFGADGGRASLEGDPCLLQVASLAPVKDHRLSITAFARIAEDHPGARLHLVGGGSLATELASLSTALDIGDRVLFHGDVPHHELPAFYRAADLHLVSSVFESQCMAVLEAAACGTGTVGTGVGILPDLGRAALTTAVGDPDSLATALLGALVRPSRVEELAEAAMARVRESHDLEISVSRLTAVYSGEDSRSR